MGLFDRKEATPISEWSDEKLIKELNRSSRSIASDVRLIQEAQRRGLKDPKTGKPY